MIFALILSVGGLIGYYAFQQAIELAKGIPDMTQPSAVDHVHLPRFLARWDVPIRAHLKSWVELHGKDMLETKFEHPPFIVIVSALAGEALAGVPGVCYPFRSQRQS